MGSMTVKTILMNETVVSTQVKLGLPAVQDCWIAIDESL